MYFKIQLFPKEYVNLVRAVAQNHNIDVANKSFETAAEEKYLKMRITVQSY
jgi:hypothetical protein